MRAGKSASAPGKCVLICSAGLQSSLLACSLHCIHPSTNLNLFKCAARCRCEFNALRAHCHVNACHAMLQGRLLASHNRSLGRPRSCNCADSCCQVPISRRQLSIQSAAEHFAEQQQRPIMAGVRQQHRPRSESSTCATVKDTVQPRPGRHAFLALTCASPRSVSATHLPPA